MTVIQQKRGNRKASVPAAAGFRYLSIFIALFFVLFPIFWQIRTSVVPQNMVYKDFSIIPHEFTLENYSDVWMNFHFSRNFLNTMFISVSITIGTLISCSLAGFAFSRLRFRGKNFIFSVYLSTLMIPFAVTIIPQYILISKLGLLNTYGSLILPFLFGAPIGTFLLRQYYLTQPVELFEAAFIDGASYFTIWSKLMLPLSTPVLATLAVMTLRDQWNSLLWPLIVTQGDKIKTLALGLSDFRLDRTLNMSGMAAAIMLGTLPMIVLLFTANKAFLKGVNLSGISR